MTSKQAFFVLLGQLSQELFAIGSLGGALAVFHAVVGDFGAIGVVTPRFEFRDAFLAGVKVNRALGRLGISSKKKNVSCSGFSRLAVISKFPGKETGKEPTSKGTFACDADSCRIL